MTSRWSNGALVAASVFLTASGVGGPGLADEAARSLTVAHLEAGTLAAGETELAALVQRDPGNDEARMGLGVVRFMAAVEHLSQGLYRYGMRSPQSFMMPVLRLPVPENPNPQPITYADFRGLIQGFVTDIAAAEAALAEVRSGDARLPLDLAQVRYDADGDGTVGPDESLIAVIQHITAFGPDDLPPTLTFAFDRADALWLRGYANVMMGFGEFVLAHDWHESFEASFFHFFPAMRSPFRDALAPPSPDMYREAAPIADFISFFHIRWPVAEPARMASVLAHFKSMVGLSRETWQAVLAETDDDREWLPGPNQESPFQSILIDEASVAAWQVVLDEMDAVLDGRKLVPHWRFTKGFNLRKVFEEPRPFDLVLWITGPAALPYLEDGPISSSTDWERIVGPGGGAFWGLGGLVEKTPPPPPRGGRGGPGALRLPQFVGTAGPVPRPLSGRASICSRARASARSSAWVLNVGAPSSCSAEAVTYSERSPFSSVRGSIASIAIATLFLPMPRKPPTPTTTALICPSSVSSRSSTLPRFSSLAL